jgi:K+-transporting ATPase c subunit
MVQADADAPVGGLFGEKFVNVLQLNLSLRSKYGQPQ